MYAKREHLLLNNDIFFTFVRLNYLFLQGGCRTRYVTKEHNLYITHAVLELLKQFEKKLSRINSCSRCMKMVTVSNQRTQTRQECKDTTSNKDPGLPTQQI